MGDHGILAGQAWPALTRLPDQPAACGGTPVPEELDIRLERHVRRALADHARLRDEHDPRLAARLIEEGLRMEEHPGIVFRDIAPGRRCAALAGGPYVWRVIQSGRESVAAAEARRFEIALGYYGTYPEEVDREIAIHRDDAQRRRLAVERGYTALRERPQNHAGGL